MMHCSKEVTTLKPIMEQHKPEKWCCLAHSVPFQFPRQDSNICLARGHLTLIPRAPPHESSINCSPALAEHSSTGVGVHHGKAASSPASGQCYVHKVLTRSHSFQRILAEKLRNEVLGIWWQCIISFWPGNFIWGQKDTWHFLPASQLIWITIHTPIPQSAALRTAPEA